MAVVQASVTMVSVADGSRWARRAAWDYLPLHSPKAAWIESVQVTGCDSLILRLEIILWKGAWVTTAGGRKRQSKLSIPKKRGFRPTLLRGAGLEFCDTFWNGLGSQEWDFVAEEWDFRNAEKQFGRLQDDAEFFKLCKEGAEVLVVFLRGTAENKDIGSVGV